MPALAAVYLLAGGSSAGASLFVAPGPAFPDRVTVGTSFSAQLGVGNFTTAPESSTAAVVGVANVDLVPACGGALLDCAGAVEAGVFGLSRTGTGSAGPASCRGTWSITETSPGVFRFTPPGGEGSVQLAFGEVCVVDYTATALGVPAADANPTAGVQINQVASATAQIPGVAPVRVSSPDQTTVDPAPAKTRPVADYDGDGKSDLAVFRPADGAWHVRRSSGGDGHATWGVAGDVPVTGDYDGDGRTDVAVYRPSASVGVWYVRNSSGGELSRAWGVAGDIPVPADYDGDGKTDVAVFRPGDSVSTWFIAGSTGSETNHAWGVPGDIPVPGDYNGDGRSDMAVFRPAQGAWLIRHSSGGTVAQSWGIEGDIPIPSDYDGDGRTDVAVYRPSQGVWFVVQSSGGVVMHAWGVNDDVPVPSDSDGDGKVDLTVFRPSQTIWFTRLGLEMVTTPWGSASDVLVAVSPALR